MLATVRNNPNLTLDRRFSGLDPKSEGFRRWYFLTHSKSPKFWRSRFFSAFDQIGVDRDRSLIQGEAFTRQRKITLPLA